MDSFKKFEKTIGGLKFAVIVILIFTMMMIAGTFLESYYGTDFANRVIYKKFPFMAVQGAMFFSILFAAFLRLPPIKRLYGFYAIHAGLVIIGCGSLITYMAGVDGNILLHPSEPTRTVYLDNDILKITYPGQGRQIIRELPYTAFETNLNEQFEGLEFSDFYPFSESISVWAESGKKFESWQSVHSSEYFISNPNVSQGFTLSLHPEAVDYKSSTQLGPLAIHYLPSSMADCFTKKDDIGIIFWDSQNKFCKTPTDYGSSIQTTKSGTRFLVITQNGKLLTFFPDLSPWPLDDTLSPVRNTTLKIFNRKLFEKKPNLFLFGEKAAFFEDETWKTAELGKKPVDLPWMGFGLVLSKHSDTNYPKNVPRYTTPIQSEGRIIKGNQKALKVVIRGESYWITDNQPLSLLIDGEKVTIEITKKTLTLPFEFVLKKFNMDKDPGTNNPASYESFVTLFTSKGPEDHHIYMNNPLKHTGFTFYQASYTPNKDGSYSSTLAANVDQGRVIKYLGSLLLVLGTIWHFVINRKKKKSKKENKIQNNKEVLA